MKKQRIALVTGANRGLGFEVARQLAQDHDYQLWLGSRDLEKGEQAAQCIGANAKAVELDVASEESVSRAFALIGAECSHIDAVVNNAGIDYDTDQRASTADLARIRRAFDTNLFGAWNVAIHSVPFLKNSDMPRLVNVSSGAGSLSDMGGGLAGYGVSKAALNALTLKLASELKSAKILVNAVCPGWTATDMGGGGRPIRDGAKGIVWAATLPNEGSTGGFFRDGKAIDW